MKRATMQIPTDKRGQATIASTKQKTPLEKASWRELTERTKPILKQLSEREKKILALGTSKMSFSKIGKIFGLSSARANKIYRVTINKIRNQLEKQDRQ